MPATKTRQRPWTRAVATKPTIAVKSAAAETYSPQKELERLVSAVGKAGAARLLGIDPANITRILQSKEAPSSEITRRILALNYVLASALEYFYPDEIVGWLTNSEPLLGGRNPLGVLTLEGPEAVIRAIHGIQAGVHA